MTAKEQLIGELVNRLRNLPHTPVISTPKPFTNWKITRVRDKIIFITLVNNAEFTFMTKDWEARLLLPKHSVFEMNANSSDAKMIINFVNMKPNDIVIDDK